MGREHQEATTDVYPQQSAPAQTMGGIVVKAAGHRFVLPTAKLLGLLTILCGVAYQAASAAVSASLARVDRLEEADRQHTRQLEIHDRKIEAQDVAMAHNAQVLAQIQASLARIDTRVAEIQVTLMREGRRYP